MEKEIKFNYRDMITLTKSMLSELSYFKCDSTEAGPITAVFDEGHDRFVVVTGENASGKSFVRKLLYSIIKQKKMECIHLSQQGRSSSGIASSLIYGDESYNSTGYLTSRLIITGINTCRGREEPHYIIWDEPDIGLSDGYAAGIGVEIRKFVETLPDLTKGVIVITHSKALVRQLLPINPSHLRLGGCPSLNSWLNSVTEPLDLKSLSERNELIFKSIQAILNDASN